MSVPKNVTVTWSSPDSSARYVCAACGRHVQRVASVDGGSFLCAKCRLASEPFTSGEWLVDDDVDS